MIKAPYELFKSLQNYEYFTSGDDVDWLIVIDDVEKVIYLLFQATRNDRDWQVNFNFPAKVYKNQKSCMRFSRGWGEAWKSCNDEIMEYFLIAVKNNPEYEICVAGWSLGGAMAIIAAEDVYYRTGIHPTLITFGAPKPCFGRKTAEYIRWCCDNKVYQYAERNDIVTYLPPFIGYHHVNRVTLGDRFSVAKIIKPIIYHCVYGGKDLYQNVA